MKWISNAASCLHSLQHVRPTCKGAKYVGAGVEELKDPNYKIKCYQKRNTTTCCYVTLDTLKELDNHSHVTHLQNELVSTSKSCK